MTLTKGRYMSFLVGDDAQAVDVSQHAALASEHLDVEIQPHAPRHIFLQLES